MNFYSDLVDLQGIKMDNSLLSLEFLVKSLAFCQIINEHTHSKELCPYQHFSLLFQTHHTRLKLPHLLGEESMPAKALSSDSSTPILVTPLAQMTLRPEF